MKAILAILTALALSSCGTDFSLRVDPLGGVTISGQIPHSGK